MELSGCVESLFIREYQGVDDRIRACGAAGLDAVEFWLWRDKDLDAIERALGDTGVRLTLFSVEPRSPLVDPATHRDFIAGLRESLVVAKRLNASALCVLADDRGVGGGDKPRVGVSRAEQHRALVAGLKMSAPIAGDAGVKLLLEPLNSVLDHKGYFLDRTPEGLDVVEEVGHPTLSLLYDLYHSAVMGEEPDSVLGNRGALVGHAHVADVPGRHEPGSGTIDWRGRIATLRAKGYEGAIGLEYWPTGGTVDSIASTRRALGG